MKYSVKKEQLTNIFDSIMKEYENLESIDRSYDYWDSLKSRYVDEDVKNFYKDIDEDYEDDDWILQYQSMPGDSATKNEVPVLRYTEYYFNNIKSMFGDSFEELMKDWFKRKYGLFVNHCRSY